MKKPCQCTFVIEHQGEIESFEHQKELFRLKAKLHAAEKQRMSSREGISLDESRARLRKIYNFVSTSANGGRKRAVARN